MKKISVVCMARTGSNRLMDILGKNFPEYCNLGEDIGGWRRFSKHCDSYGVPNSSLESYDRSVVTPSQIMFDHLEKTHIGVIYKYLNYHDKYLDFIREGFDLTDTKAIAINRPLEDIILPLVIVKTFKGFRRKHDHAPFNMDLDVVRHVSNVQSKLYCEYRNTVELFKRKIGDDLIEVSYDQVIDDQTITNILANHLDITPSTDCDELFKNKYGDYKSFVINYDKVMQVISEQIGDIQNVYTNNDLVSV